MGWGGLARVNLLLTINEETEQQCGAVNKLTKRAKHVWNHTPGDIFVQALV